VLFRLSFDGFCNEKDFGRLSAFTYCTLRSIQE
jgi:hypothetical protein